MKNEITNFKIQPLTNPTFIKTHLATYEQNGILKDWDIVESHDSVAILLYHKQKDALILVKQFRPAVYHNNLIHGESDGMTIELCAGIIDKDLTLEEIAKEEIEEECGYSVEAASIERVCAFHTSVGFAGSKQTLYYCEVDEQMRSHDGGGVDGELIEVVELPVSHAKNLMCDESIAKTPGLMFAFMWFFEKKYNPKI